MLIFNKTILKRGLVRVVIEEHENYTSEKIEIKDEDKWVAIIGSNDNYSTLNFWSKNNINSKALAFRKRTKKKLYYQLDDDEFSINLDYCLEEDNIIHIRCKLLNIRELSLSRICANYAILLDADPDYTWVPHLRPKKDLIIGDHIFRSPVVIYKKDKLNLTKLALGGIILYGILEFLKPLIGRQRPDLSDNESFPSRHTALAFFIAFMLPVEKKWKVVLFIWASLVGLSRLILTEHWLSDVITGAGIGLVAGYLIKKKITSS